jgi:uncharacterized protein (TIGR03000 family)
MTPTIVRSGQMLVVAAAILFAFASPNAALARGGHGGHGGGGHHGGAHHGGFHHGAIHHGAFHHGAFHHLHHYYHHGRFYYAPSFGWSYAYPSYDGNGFLIYPEPCDHYYDVAPAPPAELRTQFTSAPADFGGSRVYLTILVPDPNAEVKVDGQVIAGAGSKRMFQSPELSPGNYSYEVKATWNVDGKPSTQTYTVKVKPGAESLVTFGLPS